MKRIQVTAGQVEVAQASRQMYDCAQVLRIPVAVFQHVSATTFGRKLIGQLASQLSLFPSQNEYICVALDCFFMMSGPLIKGLLSTQPAAVQNMQEKSVQSEIVGFSSNTSVLFKKLLLHS